MFLKYFLSFTASKITEKVEFTKNATGKTSVTLRRRCINCHDAAYSYSRTIKYSNAKCVWSSCSIAVPWDSQWDSNEAGGILALYVFTQYEADLCKRVPRTASALYIFTYHRDAISWKNGWKCTYA